MSHNTTRCAVDVFSDGSCQTHTGIGGWAAVLSTQGFRKEISGPGYDTTSNAMELTAILEALKCLRLQGQCVNVWSDSQNAVGWLTGNYRIKQESIRALVDAIRQVIRDKGLNVAFHWVKGHTNANADNVIADRLAEAAMRKAVSVLSGAAPIPSQAPEFVTQRWAQNQGIPRCPVCTSYHSRSDACIDAGRNY